MLGGTAAGDADGLHDADGSVAHGVRVGAGLAGGTASLVHLAAGTDARRAGSETRVATTLALGDAHGADTAATGAAGVSCTADVASIAAPSRQAYLVRARVPAAAVIARTVAGAASEATGNAQRQHQHQPASDVFEHG
jgi:hypothetical protein